MTTTSPVFTTTYDTGGTAKASDEVTVVPDRARTTESFGSFLGGELNAPFIADFLAAAVMHVQCGRHLFRSVAGRTQNPVLKRRYQDLAEKAERTVLRLQQATIGLGGEPGYVSPSARATEKLAQGALEATFLIDGSLDIMSRELAMVDAVLLATTVDDSNWEILDQIAESLPTGRHRDLLRDLVTDIRPEVTENLVWARSTRHRMIMMQAKHQAMAGLQATAEAALERIKGLFVDDR